MSFPLINVYQEYSLLSNSFGETFSLAVKLKAETVLAVSLSPT